MSPSRRRVSADPPPLPYPEDELDRQLRRIRDQISLELEADYRKQRLRDEVLESRPATLRRREGSRRKAR